MRVQDLVFIAVILAVAITAVRIGGLAVRRRWREARQLFRRSSALVGLYLAAVAGTSLLSPRRWLGLGEEQRFDDWALTVLRVQRSETGYRADVRVTNHGIGRLQRAADADLVLVASDGRRFPALDAPAERSLQSVVQPGESFETSRDFAVPPGTEIIGLDVIHGAWPELFIIGDRGSLFARRPLVRVK